MSMHPFKPKYLFSTCITTCKDPYASRISPGFFSIILE